MATSPYERLRTLVERLNEADRGLPDRKSANLSDWQHHCCKELINGCFPAPSRDLTIHGSRADELARVLEAYATLARNGVREFQPKEPKPVDQGQAFRDHFVGG
jgi:hypothetical protein